MDHGGDKRVAVAQGVAKRVRQLSVRENRNAQTG